MAFKIFVFLAVLHVSLSSSDLTEKDDFVSQDDCFISGLQCAGCITKVGVKKTKILVRRSGS